MSGNSLATPVELVEVGSGVWRGEVVPFDSRLDVYLVIERGENGAFTAFIREPERNSGLRIAFETVSVQGGEVRLMSPDGRGIVGRYDKSTEMLSLTFPFSPLTLDFTRRGADEATGFYPRTPKPARYQYHQPLPELDGWETSLTH